MTEGQTCQTEYCCSQINEKMNKRTCLHNSIPRILENTDVIPEGETKTTVPSSPFSLTLDLLAATAFNSNIQTTECLRIHERERNRKKERREGEGEGEGCLDIMDDSGRVSRTSRSDTRE